MRLKGSKKAREMSDKIAYILGTSRNNGNTRLLLEAFIESCPGKVVDLSRLEISYFDYEHKNQGNDYLKTIESLLGCHVIGIISPMYWYSVSAQMKTFIDRLSDLLSIRKDLGKALSGKKLFLAATESTEGELPNCMIEQIKLTADYMDMEFVGSFYARFLADLEITEGDKKRAGEFIKSLSSEGRTGTTYI